MAFTRPLKCDFCGKDVVGGVRRKYCHACAKKVQAMQVRAWRRAHPEKVKQDHIDNAYRDKLVADCRKALRQVETEHLADMYNVIERFRKEREAA